MEMYIDGILESYTGHSGSIRTADEDITFGQKSNAATQYYLNGIIDEVKIFNAALQPWQIEDLKTMWYEENITSNEPDMTKGLHAYPNPVTDHVVFVNILPSGVRSVSVTSPEGRSIGNKWLPMEDRIQVKMDPAFHGLVFLRIETNREMRRYKLILK
jgi:hypothetical protein